MKGGEHPANVFTLISANLLIHHTTLVTAQLSWD